ncbi:MAG: HPr-rel-A system PqqD family peptide chaperone, partial [Actinomycetota bacterium]
IVDLDQEAVIYDERSGDLHHLNPTATLVFQLLDGSATIRELSADIAEAFGLNPEEVEGQVRALVRRFRRADDHGRPYFRSADAGEGLARRARVAFLPEQG